jgi:hypothetical protein
MRTDHDDHDPSDEFDYERANNTARDDYDADGYYIATSDYDSAEYDDFSSDGYSPDPEFDYDFD